MRGADRAPHGQRRGSILRYRLDLTKEQRDQHIRRYAELLKAREETAASSCATSLADGRKSGPQHRPGIASKVAEQTGLSTRTVQRRLSPHDQQDRDER